MTSEDETKPLLDRGATDSLAPIQLERMSVEELALVEGKGKARALWPLLAMGALLVLGGGSLWKQLEENHLISQAGEATNALHEQGFEAFANCVFPGEPGARIRDDDQLRTTIERHSKRLGARYGRVIQQCSRPLYDLEDGLEKLSTPTELAPARAQMSESASALLAAARDYAAYLQTESGYDFVSAQPKIEAVAVAWHQYRDSHEGFNEALHTALY